MAPFPAARSRHTPHRTPAEACCRGTSGDLAASCKAGLLHRLAREPAVHHSHSLGKVHSCAGSRKFAWLCLVGCLLHASTNASSTCVHQHPEVGCPTRPHPWRSTQTAGHAEWLHWGETSCDPAAQESTSPGCRAACAAALGLDCPGTPAAESSGPLQADPAA